MRTFPLILCALTSLLLSACVVYPTPYRSTSGRVAYAGQVGGKILHTINADGSMAMNSDMEVSLQHVAQMLTTVGLGYIDFLRTKVTELTAQLANTNLTSLEKARINADLAKFTAELKAAESLKSQGIGAGAPLGQITF